MDPATAEEVTVSRLLEIHFFGADKGESIVFKTPQGEWGVIDCFARKIEGGWSNATLEFLTKRHVESLSFLCMTHAHDDHFFGMSQLLSRFRVGIFCRPAVLCGQMLRQLLKIGKVSAAELGREDLREIQAELEEIIRLVNQQASRKISPLVEKQAILGTPVFPNPFTDTAEVKVRAISPSTRQKNAFEKGLRRCFDGNKLKNMSALPQESHNRSSLALSIEFGKTRLILGGDVEQSGWNDVLSEMHAEQLTASLVKVPHHGSPTGNTTGLWKAFCAAGKPISVITAFRLHNLPRHEVVQHIEKHSCSVFTPNSRLILDNDIHSAEHTSELDVQGDLVKGAVRRRLPVPTTRLGFYFDSLGECVKQDFDPEAGQIINGFT